MNKKITYVEDRQTLNPETGEVKEKQSIRQMSIPQEEDYIKVYIKHINYLNNLPQGLDSIIYVLMKYMTYGNQIVINSAIKRQIAEELDKKFNTVNQYISKLVSYDILIRIDTGIYILNPEFYGKGKWKDIMELREELEIKITYKEKTYNIEHKHKEQPNLFNYDK